MVYFVNNLYAYDNPGEERKSWNSSDNIDPATKNPCDWNKPPHK